MPLRSHAPSRPETDADIAVVALSARALAAAARRAGLRPLVFDLFGDEDTRALAATYVRLRDGGGLSLDADDLITQLGAHVPAGVPVVLGSGFEDRPELVETLATRFRLLASGRRTLTWLKTPEAFAGLLADLRVPHPRVFVHTAPKGLPTVEKQAGGAGGGHVRFADTARGAGRYLQEFVAGHAVSALFLGNGRQARLIGFSEQWCAPAPGAPFRYGGAVGPIRLAAPLEVEIAQALGAITGASGVVGLASADLIVDGSRWWLIEINPRPGATLDLFDRAPLPPLMKLHIAACAGSLPDLALAEAETFGGVQAAAILYADRPVETGTDPLPDWTADRPAPGTPIGPGEPVCTVFAGGSTVSEARAVLAGRLDHIWHGLNAAGRQAAE